MSRESLLEGAAALAFVTAPRCCTANPGNGRTCLYIHRLWPTLRMMGLAMSAELHRDFFMRALGAEFLRREGASRVLVSGASDHALPAIVFDAARAVGRPVSVTVVDRCDTPLAVNRWYAARENANLATLQSDILSYEDSAGFDVICTHSFLSFFTAEQRDALAAKWMRLLRPGGAAITVNRLRQDGARSSGFSAEDGARYAAEVQRRASGMQHRMPAAAEEIARLAAEQAAMPGGAQAIRSEQEFRAIFERAGYDFDEFVCQPLPAPAQTEIWGLGIPSNAPYVQIIARKPATLR